MSEDLGGNNFLIHLLVFRLWRNLRQVAGGPEDRAHRQRLESENRKLWKQLSCGASRQKLVSTFQRSTLRWYAEIADALRIHRPYVWFDPLNPRRAWDL